MKKITKLISAILIFVLMCSVASGAFAYSNGAVIGKACYTDIKATINGYDIASYNVDGYTYIVAEDLRYYGFDVVWSPYSRTLSVTRNGSYYPSTNYTAPFITQDLVGKKSYNLLYTDIQTYVNGSWVQSYNINGRTIIRFDALSAFGSVWWVQQSKDIGLSLPHFANKSVDMNKYYQKNTYIDRAKQIEREYDYFCNNAATQYELNVGSGRIAEMWDTLLNDIYRYLKTTLSSSEFSKLKSDELRWIEEKEAAIDATAWEWYGGSGAPMACNLTEIAYTQDRCYYLISLIRP